MGSLELIKSSAICNESAWGLFEQILRQEIQGYPVKYQHYEVVIKVAFDLRRNASLNIITHREASAGLISLMQELPDESQDLLTEPFIYIRDFFVELKSPSIIRGNRRNN